MKFPKAILVLISISLLCSYSEAKESSSYDKDIKKYKEIIRVKPNDAEAHYNLGLMYDQKGVYNQAIEEYKKAIKLKPKLANAYHNLGVAYGMQGLDDKAIEEFKEAIRINPDLAEAHCNLGVAYRGKDLNDEAIKEYKEAIRIKPDYVMAHNNLGIVYYEKGLYDEAIEEYKKAIRIKPEDAIAHSNLGVAYGKKGLDEKEIEEYKETIRLNPAFEEAHYNLGMAYLQLGRREDALDEYKILKEMDKESANELLADINKISSDTVSIDNSGLRSAFAITFYYGKPLVYLYIYLLIAGFILSSNFKNKLKRLVEGKVGGGGFKGTALYGLHLIILFPYLYIVLAFSVLLVWDFVLVAGLFVYNVERMPVALFIALFVVVFGSLWAILKGFFGSKKRDILGVLLKREEQPKIWELCDKVAKDVGTKTVDEIYLSPLPGIGVHLSGALLSLLIGRTKRTLTIGMGSIPALSISQMEAILAHEFGHFSNKDTAWNSLTFTMAAVLQNTLSTMPNPWNSGDSGWIKYTSALNPALWVLLGYRLLFSVVTNGFSRMREVFADKTAIVLYGYKNFTDGLMKVARNDYMFSNYFFPEMEKIFTEEGKINTNIFHTMDQTYQSSEGNKLTDIDKSILDQEVPSVFDSHPLLKDRLSYAKYFEVEDKHTTQKNDFKTIFSNWDKVSKNMSDLYTYYIEILISYKFNEKQKDNKETSYDKKPDDAETHFGLGAAYGKKGLYGEAIKEYKEAIRIKPDFAEAHYNLGAIYGMKPLYDQAIEEFKEAIRIKPDYVNAHYCLGVAYLNINRRGDAIDEYKILKELDKELANKLFKQIYE